MHIAEENFLRYLLLFVVIFMVIIFAVYWNSNGRYFMHRRAVEILPDEEVELFRINLSEGAHFFKGDYICRTTNRAVTAGTFHFTTDYKHNHAVRIENENLPDPGEVDLTFSVNTETPGVLIVSVVNDASSTIRMTVKMEAIKAF